MADGFDIPLGPEQASHLRAAADARGLDPVDYARQLLEQALDADDPWAVARARATHYDATGESMSIDEAFAKLEEFRGQRK